LLDYGARAGWKLENFEFRLPAASAETLVLPNALTPSDGVLRILVVDDLPILSQLVCEYLKDDLHIVETALSGSEALEKFRAADFDLVITGQLVSGISGEEMAAAIKQISPKTPVIFLTGYAGDSPAPRTHSAAIDLVLEKPVSRSALRQALAGFVIR
jgi:CheY-like chemotaxis protein